MIIDDLRTAEINGPLETDLCILGSGPAGLTIASEFANTHVKVLVIESGGLDEDPVYDSLGEIESVGVPRVMDQTRVRNRIVGGTSHTWSGRCSPLDEIDFEYRDWVPYSGWPITPTELSVYFDRAAPYLGIAPEGYDGKLWYRAGEPEIDTALLRRCFWQYSRDADQPTDSMRFSRRFLRTRSSNVRLLHHATARNIGVNVSATRVEFVLLTCPEGKTAIVRPKVLVMCAGGIENARLLLCSNEVMPSGLGNARGLVGQFLMDHPRCDVADFDLINADSILDRLGRQRVHHAGGQPIYVHGFALSRQQQEDKQLLNCAGWLDVTVADDDPISIAKRLLNRGQKRLVPDIMKILSQPSSIVRSARDILQRRPTIRRKYKRMTLQCAVEQRPDPDSRVRLSTRKDAVGMQLAQIDWRISDQEKESIATLGRLIAQEFARIGFPTLSLAEWIVHNRLDESKFIDIAHPIGATRMSDTLENGVVDRHCQVHGLKGVFIAGSSVFPTAGHANPTQTISALSIRLADRLKSHVFGLSITGSAA